MQQTGVSADLWENLLVAERNNVPDMLAIAQKLSHRLAIFRLKEFVRANVAEESIGIEQSQPALNEADVNVEVAGSRRAIVRLQKLRRLRRVGLHHLYA